VSTPNALLAGRYRLTRLIATGGMGVVWEARDELLERPVAVKELRPQAGIPDDEAELAKNRAMREARITARLHHPHAVPVFDVIEHDGRPCLIMQYVPSRPLSELVREAGVLPVADAARMGGQIASALTAAHKLGIVHRDVKPGNILITEDGSAMISDFGISHALGDATLTSTGLVHGTPAYLAPEVARGAESGFSSDVFSLGSTLYAMVEGQPPFGTDSNSIALLHKVASGQFLPPQRAGALASLIVDMLAADPAARPDMKKVTRRLGVIERESEKTAILPTTVPTSGSTAAPEPAEPAAVVAPTGSAAEDEPTVAAEPPTALLAADIARHDPVGTAPFDTSVETAAMDHAATPERPARAEPTRADEVTAPPRRAPEPRRRRRPLAPLLTGLGVVVLLALAVLIGSSVLRGQAGSASDAAPGDGDVSASPPAVAPSASSSEPAATTAPDPAPDDGTDDSASDGASDDASDGDDGGDAPSVDDGDDLATAIEDYYDLVPGDTDGAWRLMTADYQQNHAGGRDSYNAFWSPVDQVEAEDITAAAPGNVQARIVYTYRDGTVTEEVTSFVLVAEDGVLKVADSTVISSADG